MTSVTRSGRGSCHNHVAREAKVTKGPTCRSAKITNHTIKSWVPPPALHFFEQAALSSQPFSAVLAQRSTSSEVNPKLRRV